MSKAKLETQAFFKLLNQDAQKEVVNTLLPKIYLLFNVDEGYNSQDLAYELDYMFQGAFTSYEQAYKNFLETLIEDLSPVEYNGIMTEEIAELLAEEREKMEKINQIYDNFENISQDELSMLLFAENWKIIETEIRL